MIIGAVFVGYGVSRVGGAVATNASVFVAALAVIAAVVAGLVPWHLETMKRQAKAEVIALRLVDDLASALINAREVADGIGHVAETKDPERVQLSASRLMMSPPNNVDELFQHLEAFDSKSLPVIAKGAMWAINIYTAVLNLKEIPIDEIVLHAKFQAAELKPPLEGRELDEAIDRLAVDEIVHFARVTADRAQKAVPELEAAIAALGRYGAKPLVRPNYHDRFTESPIHFVATRVKQGDWPPSDCEPWSHKNLAPKT
ncbi:hypothetical protein [Pseudoxanthomonas sp. JBR18]|uniref:hypothetical protein n=1 Tax=Pseudoxanthomonas sp. JBR18 TaxID=2969308 RepID=UPI0023056281|nr:hypothetical protein [Pseudoxanthomonas sp. JBR18]WCE02812.1 hypothetical protein PJ250_11725 [Pseudoxanthomonas sp. JBR18]